MITNQLSTILFTNTICNKYICTLKLSSNHSRNLCRCFPIDIGRDDPFFGQFGKQCLDFTRSSTHCQGDQSDQINTVTAFLDGSVIYGASEAMGMRLRGGARRGGGRLVGNTHLPHFLPSKFDLNMKSRASDKSTDFVAGDARAETQVLYKQTMIILTTLL